MKSGRVYLFAIGIIDPIRKRKAADRAVRFIKTLPGLAAVHPNPEYTLLCFDTLDNAIKSRARYTETGNDAGRYIMEGEIEESTGTLIVKDIAFDSKGVS